MNAGVCVFVDLFPAVFSGAFNEDKFFGDVDGVCEILAGGDCDGVVWFLSVVAAVDCRVAARYAVGAVGGY